MATPKILPPRPQSSRPPPASRQGASRPAGWPSTSPPAIRAVGKPIAATPVARIAVAKKPAPPLPSVRIEIRADDIQSIEDVVDPIDVLFDAMEDLSFAETAVEAGAVCLASLVRAIPSRGGIVHLYDAEARDFVAVYAMGPRAERLVLTRAAESDVLIGAALRKHEPIVVEYGRGSQAPQPLDRHFLLSAKRNVMVCPIVDGSRFLGALELVDAKRAAGFDKASEHAIAYVADRYAGFLVEHGVMIANVVAPPSGFIS